MKNNNYEKIEIVSPLEIKHFLLDVPILKSNYQLNAVKYAMKSLYPGNENTTSFDYAYIKDRVIGIAANTAKIESLKKNEKKIISPTLLVLNILKNGIGIFIGDRWVELQVIKNGIPQLITDYNIFQLTACIEDCKRINHENGNEDLSVNVFYCNKPEDDILMEIRENNFKYENISDYFSSSLINKSAIFIKRKNRSNPVKYGVLVILAVLLFLDYRTFNKAESWKQEVSMIKKEYQAEKSRIEKTEIIEKKETEKEIPEVYDISSVFSEIYNCSPAIRIISMIINNGGFKFEAENAKAIKVLDTLALSDLFYDVELHQSIPQEDGTERFVISGKIRND